MKNISKGNDGEWLRLRVPKEEVNIATVLSCGQSFRWKNDGPDPDEWIGVFANYLWILKQIDDTHILYKVIGNPRLEDGHYNKLLWKYFQLDIALPQLYMEWSQKDSNLFGKIGNDYQGIRILEQDPIENIFSFICSANNNIIRISQMVEKMALFYGEPVGELYGKTYYKFPTVENLCGGKVEKKLREEKFGYRAAYIANAASKIVDNGGAEWAKQLKTLTYEEAHKQLQTLPGVGRKVADCVCLMSMGFHDAIPVDTHIYELGKKYLPHLNKVKSLTDKVYSEITDYFRLLFGTHAGWAQSVLFASTLRHLKSDKAVKTEKRKKGDNKIDNDDDSVLSNLVQVTNPSIKTESTEKSTEAENVQRANKNIGHTINGARSKKRRRI